MSISYVKNVIPEVRSHSLASIMEIRASGIV